MEFSNCFNQKQKHQDDPILRAYAEAPSLAALLAELYRSQFDRLPPPCAALPEIQICEQSKTSPEKSVVEEKLATGDVVKRYDDGRTVIELINGEKLTVAGSSWTLRDKNDKLIASNMSRTGILTNGAQAGFIVPFAGPGWFYISYPNSDGITLRIQEDRSNSNLDVNIYRGGKSVDIKAPPDRSGSI